MQNTVAAANRVGVGLAYGISCTLGCFSAHPQLILRRVDFRLLWPKNMFWWWVSLPRVKSSPLYPQNHFYGQNNAIILHGS